MKTKMIAARSMTYGTRRLQAGEAFEAPRRDARLLAAMGRAKTVEVEEAGSQEPRDPLDHDSDGRKDGSESGGDALKALRAEYHDVVGKRPFAGWDADTLRAKIDEAKA